MTTAFGRAMIATINGQPRTFRMSMEDGPSINLSCEDYCHLRDDEIGLLQMLELPEKANVLDYGCGIGRHLSLIRRMYPSAFCYGIEICDLMLEHCRNEITPPAAFLNSLDEVDEIKFDLVLLIGNGLGILGDESSAKEGLRELVGLLHPEGQIIIETCNPFGSGYFSSRFRIRYQEHQDKPFTWGYADEDWIRTVLEDLDCHVRFHRSNAPGGMFFFAVGTKPKA